MPTFSPRRWIGIGYNQTNQWKYFWALLSSTFLPRFISLLSLRLLNEEIVFEGLLGWDYHLDPLWWLMLIASPMDGMMTLDIAGWYTENQDMPIRLIIPHLIISLLRALYKVWLNSRPFYRSRVAHWTNAGMCNMWKRRTQSCSSLIRTSRMPLVVIVL